MSERSSSATRGYIALFLIVLVFVLGLSAGILSDTGWHETSAACGLLALLSLVMVSGLAEDKE